jgi:hypothetical protein
VVPILNVYPAEGWRTNKHFFTLEEEPKRLPGVVWSHLLDHIDGNMLGVAAHAASLSGYQLSSTS